MQYTVRYGADPQISYTGYGSGRLELNAQHVTFTGKRSILSFHFFSIFYIASLIFLVGGIVIMGMVYTLILPLQHNNLPLMVLCTPLLVTIFIIGPLSLIPLRPFTWRFDSATLSDISQTDRQVSLMAVDGGQCRRIVFSVNNLVDSRIIHTGLSKAPAESVSWQISFGRESLADTSGFLRSSIKAEIRDKRLTLRGRYRRVAPKKMGYVAVMIIILLFAQLFLLAFIPKIDHWLGPIFLSSFILVYIFFLWFAIGKKAEQTVTAAEPEHITQIGRLISFISTGAEGDRRHTLVCKDENEAVEMANRLRIPSQETYRTQCEASHISSLQPSRSGIHNRYGAISVEGDRVLFFGLRDQFKLWPFRLTPSALAAMLSVAGFFPLYLIFANLAVNTGLDIHDQWILKITCPLFLLLIFVFMPSNFLFDALIPVRTQGSLAEMCVTRRFGREMTVLLRTNRSSRYITFYTMNESDAECLEEELKKPA